MPRSCGCSSNALCRRALTTVAVLPCPACCPCQMFNGSVFTTLRIESSHMAQLDELFADDVLTLEAGVGAWAEGKLAADKAKFFAPGCTILAGPGNVSGFKTYTYDTIGAWETELAAYDFKDMTWSFYQAPGGAIGEWTVSSLVHKVTLQRRQPP